METIHKAVFIEAPPDKVFEYTTDPAHYGEFWPSMGDVSNVHLKPDGSADWDWIYKMAGVKFHGHAETAEVQRNRLRVIKNTRGIPSTFRWSFEPRANGTDLRLDVEYEIPGSLLARLAAPFLRRLNEQEAETTIQSLKDRMEMGTAASA
jgi:uncharacterized protein YndB with AHSA1/START domain